MTSVLYIGGSGPPASISKHNVGTDMLLRNPPVPFLNLIPGGLGGNIGSSRRRLWFLAVGTSFCTGMTWNGTPVDFFDNSEGEIVLGSIGEPSATTGTIQFQLDDSLTAQHFRATIFISDGLGKPTTPTDDDFNSVAGVAPSTPITVASRKNGIIIGGGVGHGAVTLSAAGIANWAYNLSGAQDWIDMYEALTTTGNRLMTISSTGAGSITVKAKAWSFR